ncbi:MAG: VWA domain-containing protein [Gammaproteobacteria bacterium]|nr:VWA domain-containing protein [Gammaproteobacteria bacterium]
MNLSGKLFAVVLIILFVSACEKTDHRKSIYMVIDTSGTYASEVDKAERVISFLLGKLNPGDSLAVAQVKSRSFSEKDIVAKVTFDKTPSKATAQKRAFREKINIFAKKVKSSRGSAFTDITGAMIQAAEFLNETGAGNKMILVFSDMQEELGKGTVRNFPIDMSGIEVVALNVTKLTTDNVDPRRYLDRLDRWEKRLRQAGAKDWKKVNDLEHLERIFR